jgi:abortive infection bacteriophage resistance protein
MAQKFNKPQLSIASQIKLLESRGLTIGNASTAEHYLQHVSYYRLRAYAMYFEVDPRPSVHGFVAGTTFEQVIALYDFDRQLRLTLLDAIERIEIAARGSWAHHMAMAYGPHGYLNQALYKSREMLGGNRRTLQQEVNRSRDDFILHYKATYNSPRLPPVWMVAEILSLGQLSKWQDSLAKRADVVAIARPFQLDHRPYLAFIHHLATIRNICAHHGRLWNKRFTVTMALPRQPADLQETLNPHRDRNLYNSLVVTLHLMRIVSPRSGWKQRLVRLLESHPVPDMVAMGFPADWRQRPLWR